MTRLNQHEGALNTNATDWPYSVARKPLTKWASERVTIERVGDQALLATFRYDGSTCTNLGHALTADFIVELTREASGDWRITRATCTPADGDTGCAATCAAIASPNSFLDALAQFGPLIDMTLSDAVAWAPSIEYSGCFCTAGNQNHKWRNAIQSIHLALTQS